MKTVLEPYHYLTNQSLATFTSNAFDCFGYYGLSIQMIVTGASGLNTSMKLQVSNNSTDWTDFPSDDLYADMPLVITADGSYFWNFLTVIPFKKLRIVNTNSAGSGVLNCFVSGVRV